MLSQCHCIALEIQGTFLFQAIIACILPDWEEDVDLGSDLLKSAGLKSLIQQRQEQEHRLKE